MKSVRGLTLILIIVLVSLSAGCSSGPPPTVGVAPEATAPATAGTPISYPPLLVNMPRADAGATNAYNTAPVRKLKAASALPFQGTVEEVMTGNGMIYVKDVEQDGQDANGFPQFAEILLALDPADFQTKWRRENPTGSHVSLNEGDFDISIDGVFTDVLVFSGFREHSLYELNSATGQEVQRQTISAGEAVIQVTPANYYTITTGQTGDDKSTIYSVERQTGRVKWSFALALSGAARITEGEGIVYLEGDEVWSDKAQNNVDTLYALDSDTGSVKWTYNCMNCRRNSGWAVASEGRVYVVGDDGLLALDGKSGKELWRDSTAVGAPAVGSRTVYIPDAKGLVARDSGTGQEKWAYGGEGVGAEPLLVGNAVYCLSVADVSFALGVTKKFRIQAVDANNGKALWNYVANGELSTSNELTGGEGAIFFQHEGQTFVFR